MIEAINEAGFEHARACHFFDSFQGTSKEHIARKFGVQGANFIAYKRLNA
jgi:hypothetical protein